MKIQEIVVEAKRTDWTVLELIKATEHALKNLSDEFGSLFHVDVKEDEINIEVQAGSSISSALLPHLRPFISRTFFDNKSRRDSEHNYHFYLNRKLTPEELTKMEEINQADWHHSKF